MSREKQIEEMAYEMTQYKGKMCERIEHNNCLLRFHAHAFIDCNFCKLAEHLITEKGYRKQSENVIELPCAIGTTIYELCYEKEDPCSWCEHDYSGFGDYICDFDYDPYPQVKDFLSGKKICPKNQMVIYAHKFNLEFYHSDEKWFNITWFLTREEAEKALAKMKGGAE